MTALATAKKSVLAMAAEIDQAELACRLIEVGCKMHRLTGLTGKEAWRDILKARDRGEIPPYIVADFWRMAEVAILFFGESVQHGKASQ